MKVRTAVFASGGGSNFQALLEHSRAAGGWKIVVLVTDRAGAGAIERARRASVPTVIVPMEGREHAEVSRELLRVLDEHGVQLILLAGYLRRVPPEVVARYRQRILNIHPALLPEFGGKGMYGMRVHQAVLEAGSEESGATVHFVDEEYDRGATLAQRRVRVLPGDSAEALAARVLAVEHRLYPAVVDHVCEAITAGRTPEPILERGVLRDVPAGEPPSRPSHHLREMQ